MPDPASRVSDVSPPSPDAASALELPRPYDFQASVRFLAFGLYDPSCRIGPGDVWQAARTPEGPVTLNLRSVSQEVRARAWGPGAAWALDRAPRILGLDDRPGTFQPPPGPLATLARRGGGLHLSRTPFVFDVLVQVIFQQRVSFREAARSHRRLVKRIGEEAPGPAGLLLPPSPRHWLRFSSEDFRRAGVDGQRASRIRSAARHARHVSATFETPSSAEDVLSRIPGCGPWTVGMTRGFALGDADAVPVGDLHLPSDVTYALAGEPQGNDERMLELLEPYRGHRFRLIRLLLSADRLRLGRGGRTGG